MLRELIVALTAAAVISAPVLSGENNDFYDNTKTHHLPLPEITVAGEISNPGAVDLSDLQRRSVIVREAFLDGSGSASFAGAYRYEGYSLFDILRERYVEKAEIVQFEPVIDLLVIVENKTGEKAVFSWGEIFYPDNLHRIIVADGVSPIVPSKTGEQWPIPENGKLVCAVDMISERNISDPSRITVMTQPVSFTIEREPDLLYSGKVELHIPGEETQEITSLEGYGGYREYPSVFYGRGRGFHGIRHFEGKMMKTVLGGVLPANRENLRRGYLCVGAADGYRITITFSELFNRNDNAEFLMVDRGAGTEGGRFLIYPAPDFFSDRAVKAITDIYFLRI